MKIFQLNKTTLNISFIVASILSISACGGSSSAPAPSPAPTPTPTPSTNLPAVQEKISAANVKIYHTDEFVLGQSASIAAISAANNVFASADWQQTAGPDLLVLAPHTQIISFDLNSAGSYSFTFSGITTTNIQITQDVSFDVIDNTIGGSANIRLDHAAVEQSKVSLRVDSSGNNTDKTISSVEWQQIAGTDAENQEKDGQYLFFDAPNVNQDTLLEFSATISYEDGSTSVDSSYVLIKETDINTDGYFPKFADQIVSTDVFPFDPNGPYASSLVDCVYNNQISSTCSFNTLPLLGQEHDSPSVEQVLQRLVVSHQWMGERFKEYLEQSAVSEDMLKLLRATTAIVISYDVRPSFYWTATGAIYLDAANFWVTPSERDTLNDQPDFRGDFGNELKFIIPWRYVKDNDYYFRSGDYPVVSRLSKDFSDLEANVSWLMYHELGHANDFFPPNRWSGISLSTNPLSYSNDVAASSSSFSANNPLSSASMTSFADVSFAGDTPSEEQKNTNAQQIVNYFEPDNAPAYYSYSTIREDYATLFERFMMLYRLGVSADVAVISTDNNEELLVSWGQRDRISESRIQGRVNQVVEQILPELNVSEIQASLPNSILMAPQVDWFTNIDLSVIGTTQSRDQKNRKKVPRNPNDYWQTYRHGPATPGSDK
ncbi:MAG: hypothetical protein ACI808_001662 [Paraglaciecola sp.]|jgi:hypothetical protein